MINHSFERPSSETRSSRILFTAGYERMSLPNLIEVIGVNQITHLIDIRANPFSRRREFCKASLDKTCSANGLEYLHFPELGIPARIRKSYLPGRRVELLSLYRTVLLPNAEKAVLSLLAIAKTYNLLLLCYEMNPRDCHRWVLAQSIHAISGITVRELRDGTELAGIESTCAGKDLPASIAAPSGGCLHCGDDGRRKMDSPLPY